MEYNCKYYKQKKQVSYDSGVTWYDVTPMEYQKGDLYEYQSLDCPYVPPTPIYRWINLDPSVDYYCSGTTKYYKQQKQVSYDSGETWENVVPAEYQMGDLYEYDSSDCGYTPPQFYFVLRNNNDNTTCSISDQSGNTYIVQWDRNTNTGTSPKLLGSFNVYGYLTTISSNDGGVIRTYDVTTIEGYKYTLSLKLGLYLQVGDRVYIDVNKW